MDIVDQAQAIEHLPVETALATARRTPRELPACGACHNCIAPIPPGLLFCDTDCRDDHTHRTRRGHP